MPHFRLPCVELVIVVAMFATTVYGSVVMQVAGDLLLSGQSWTFAVGELNRDADLAAESRRWERQGIWAVDRVPDAIPDSAAVNVLLADDALVPTLLDRATL